MCQVISNWFISKDFVFFSFAIILNLGYNDVNRIGISSELVMRGTRKSNHLTQQPLLDDVCIEKILHGQIHFLFLFH